MTSLGKAGLIGAAGVALVVLMGAGAWWLLDGREGGEARDGSSRAAPAASSREDSSSDGAARDAGLAERSETTAHSRAGEATGSPEDSEEASSTDQGAPMWSFAGRLVDEAGQPLVGVPVRVSVPAAWIGMAEEECARGRSDARGAFVVEVAPRPRCRRLRVGIEPPQHVWLSEVVPLSESGRAELGTWVVPGGGGLVGGVFGPGGAAIGGAKVVVRAKVQRGRHPVPPSVRVVHCDPTGRFVVDALAAGGVSLTASAPGHVDSWLEELDIEAGRRTGPVAISLARGAVIAGRVVDEQGAAVPDARVMALRRVPMPGDWVDDGRSVRTDDQGSFRLDQIQPEPQVLRVEAPGCLPLHVEAVAPGREDLHLVVRRSARLRGRVVDDEGRPVDGLSVSLHRNAFFDIEAEGDYAAVLLGADAVPAGTDPAEALGRFMLQDVTLDALHVLCESQGHVDVMAGPYRLEPGAEIDTTIVLPRGGRVRGEVRDERGAPVGGAEVVATPLAERGRGRGAPSPGLTSSGPEGRVERRHPQRARTEADGSFELGDLPLGRLRLRATHPSWVESEELERELSATAPLEDQILVLRRGGRLWGTVIGRDGEPLSGATVSVQSESAPTARRLFGGPRTESTAEGRYEFVALAAGDYRVKVHDPRGFADGAGGSEDGAAVRIDLGAEVQLDLELPAVGAVQLRVLDGQGPVAGASVTAIDPRASVWAGFSQQRTDAAGDGRFEGLALGSWLFRVHPPGGAPAVERRVEVVDSQELQVDVMLEGLTLRGRVLDDAGVGVAGVVLQVHRPASDPEGPDSGRETGVVAEAREAEFTRLLAQGLLHGAETSSSDAEGGFAIPYLPPGPLRLVASGPGIQPTHAELVLGPDTATTELRVDRAGILHLSGRSRARIGWSRWTMTPEQGSRTPRELVQHGLDRPLRFDSLEPGEWTLRVESEGRLVHESSLRIDAGEQTREVELDG